MPLRREAGDFWGAKRRVVERGGFRFEALSATAPEKDVVLHSHEKPHFVFVLEGSYISGAKGAPALSAMPLLIFNPAGTTHRDRFLHGRGSFLAITLSDELGTLAPELFFSEGEARLVRDLSSIYFAKLTADLMFGDDASDYIDDLGLTLLSSVTSHEVTDPRLPPPWLRQAFEMIMEEAGAVRVRDVAAYVSVHPVHLARVFQNHIGRSPGEMLRERQMERAATLIKNTDSSLACLSAATGFTDQSHFSNRFRNAFGMSPHHWRLNDVAFLQDE